MMKKKRKETGGGQEELSEETAEFKIKLKQRRAADKKKERPKKTTEDKPKRTSSDKRPVKQDGGKLVAKMSFNSRKETKTSKDGERFKEIRILKNEEREAKKTDRGNHLTDNCPKDKFPVTFTVKCSSANSSKERRDPVDPSKGTNKSESDGKKAEKGSKPKRPAIEIYRPKKTSTDQDNSAASTSQSSKDRHRFTKVYSRSKPADKTAAG